MFDLAPQGDKRTDLLEEQSARSWKAMIESIASCEDDVTDDMP